MKILVIGSKGFIGSHLIKYFSELPSVICWGADVVVDYAATNYLLIDATNSDFSEVFQQLQFDVCINCSGAASVQDSIKHPLRDFTLNVYNVAKILEAIKTHASSCRFINISSAAVYGNPLHLPIKEADECSPVSPYGLHKLMAENVCSEYNRYFSIQTCSVRIFSAYGPGLQKQILWDIYRQTKQQQHIQLFGTGKETRDFIYITDIAKAFHSVIRNGAFDASIYNVASGIEVSIQYLAEELLSALSFKGSLSFSGEVRKGDPVNWQADITGLKALGFSTEFDISKGIKEYVEWLKEKE